MKSILDNRSYHIEFNGHLTDHSKHGVVALEALGAGEETIRHFYTTYAEMTPYGFGLEKDRGGDLGIDHGNWRKFLGQRKHFSSYCSFFHKEAETLGISECIRFYVPDLIGGWCGAFSHALIHLGFALDSKNHTMIAEGLAYLCFSYLRVHEEEAPDHSFSSTAKGSCLGAIKDISRFWQEDDYSAWFKEVSGEESEQDSFIVHPELRRSGLQYRIARILDARPKVMYREVDFLHRSQEEVWSEFYYAMTILFLAHPGDFINLHLLTSLHSMKKVASFLSSEDERRCQKLFWLGAMTFLHARGEFFDARLLDGLHRKYRDVIDPGSDSDWTQTIERSFCEKEEHNPKLVYVLKKRWEVDPLLLYRVAANCFTTTPSLPKSFEREITY